MILPSFKIFEEDKELQRVIDFINEIELKYEENFFTTDFAALNYDQSKEIAYKYQLKGIDPDWIYPSDGRQSANYTDINEGSYGFLVSAKTENGIQYPEV